MIEQAIGVRPTPEGFEARGLLVYLAPSTPESNSTKQTALRFNAVLTNDSQEVTFDRPLGHER